ncbi:MAG: Holliday junction branch migration protein RuvA [Gammaproteobacteria bacterium]|nr:Holliday junction branch migration protein RuvA [Gammaproteobacteria bacterium]
MISHLRGTLVSKKPPQLVVDVNGVGYEVEAPMSTFYALPETGTEVSLFTHLAVREDAHTLFGFVTQDERRLFRSLIKISGVGAKLALTILSGMSVEAFARCVDEEDPDTLVRLPGVGKKTAARLLVEMRDRIKDAVPGGSGVARAASKTNATAEAQDALEALGYKNKEIARLLKSIDTEGLSTEEIIRLALQGAVRK